MNTIHPAPALSSLLSLDPSCRSIGWAILGPGPSYIASGVDHPLGMDVDERIRTGVVDVVMRRINEFQPAAILIEMPDYIGNHERGTHSQNFIKYVRAVGAAEAAAARFGRPIHYAKSTALKLATAKEDRMRRFNALVGRPPQTNDESDAFCIGWDFLLSRASPMPQPSPFPDL
jgi:Holliday junction resolvasome RuvABC endonuclease subunit